MDKKKYLIICVISLLIFGLAAFAYKYLSQNYSPSLSDAAAETEISSDNQSTDAGEDPKTPAPDFSLMGRNGQRVSLSDFKGKPVVLNFWATWCGPCKYELPAFENAYKAYGDRVEFMMINLTDGAKETVAGVEEFMTNNNYSFPVYYDEDIHAASIYGAYAIPLTVFIDAEGNILTGVMSAISEETLNKYIELLLESNQ